MNTSFARSSKLNESIDHCKPTAKMLPMVAMYISDTLHLSQWWFRLKRVAR